MKKQIQRLEDEIRYSDSVSGEDLDEMESEIERLLMVLKESIRKGNTIEITNISGELMGVVKERNRRRKAGK